MEHFLCKEKWQNIDHLLVDDIKKYRYLLECLPKSESQKCRFKCDVCNISNFLIYDDFFDHIASSHPLSLKNASTQTEANSYCTNKH